MRIRLEWDRPGRPPSPARMTAVLLVGLTLEAPAAPGHDVCLMLDTSKSMEGEKLSRALEACRLAVSALQPADRLALCTYATGVRTLAPLTALGALDVAGLLEGLAGVRAGGCTLTQAALQHAAALFGARADTARPATLLLITDGHPTDARGKRLPDTSAVAALAEAPGLCGVTLCPVGLGSGDDFDTAFLETLADRGRGAFCHAESPAALGALLGDRLRRAHDVAVGAATLEVRGLADSVQMEAACRIAPEYAEIAIPGGPVGATELPLGALAAGGESVFLLRVATTGRFGVEGRQPTVRVSARAGAEQADGEAALTFTGAPREQQRVNEEANRYRLAWELAVYQSLVNASNDAGRTGDLLERIRVTGELIGNPAVVGDAEARLRELRETGALSGSANARATAHLRETGELVRAAAPVDRARTATEGVETVVSPPGGGIGFGGGLGRPATPSAQEQAAGASPVPGAARLTVRVGRRVGAAYPLTGEELSIGRNAPPVAVGLDLTEQEMGDRYTVSRRHALLTWEEGRCLLRDLGSKAGTIVNGTALTPPAGTAVGEAIELHIGDRIVVGSVELEVTADA